MHQQGECGDTTSGSEVDAPDRRQLVVTTKLRNRRLVALGVTDVVGRRAGTEKSQLP